MVNPKAIRVVLAVPVRLLQGAVTRTWNRTMSEKSKAERAETPQDLLIAAGSRRKTLPLWLARQGKLAQDLAELDPDQRSWLVQRRGTPSCATRWTRRRLDGGCARAG